MPRHHETRNLPYTPDQMFDLVADVEHYPAFLPWVVAVRIRSDSKTTMLADLVAGFGAVRESFTSKVHKHRPGSIVVDYVEGPLKYLHNEWRFEADGRGGSNLYFEVDFAFRSRIFEALAGQMFDHALRRMIGAFEARAHALYGPPCSTGIKSSSAHSAA